MHRTEDVLSTSLKPEILPFDLVALFTRFEAIHRIIWSRLDHVWWEDRSEWLIGHFETVFSDDVSSTLISESIHHPLDEGELELHEISLEIGKTSTCDIRGALLIDPSTNGCDFCMILHWEVELSDLSPIVLRRTFSSSVRPIGVSGVGIFGIRL
jgi:hypothetical protein